ncbi:MAG: hypothetical protein WKF97_24925 [Chitinophagaceae bacterium]
MKSIILAIAFIIAVCGAAQAQQISIQPSILDYHLAPGNTESQAITITNLSRKKMIFEANLADWLRDSTGSHEYYKADTLLRSCANWVSVDKDLIELEPGESKNLLVKLRVPADPAMAKEMKWAMLFLQSVSEQDSTSRDKKKVSTKINEVVRVGIHIYQTPPYLTRKEAKAVSFTSVAGEKNSYEFTMANTGDVMLHCKAHLELTNVASGKETKLNNIEFPVFPGGARKIKLVVPGNLSSGKYSALAVLDLDEDLALEALEKEIEVR